MGAETQKGIALRLNTMYNKNKTKARGAVILGSLHMKNTQSGRMALCGVLAALTVAILLAGTALGIGTYAAPMLASFLLIPALVEYGPRTALTQYVASAVTRRKRCCWTASVPLFCAGQPSWRCSTVPPR